MGNKHGNSQIYGKDSPFEIVGRSDSWAEQRIATCHIVGPYKSLVGKNLKPGDPMTNIGGWVDGYNGQYYARTVDVVKEEGGMGQMTVTLVLCKNGKTKPFHETWEVSMEEVQKKLICHPKIVEAGVVEELFKWEETPKRYRTKSDKQGNTHYYYATGDMEGESPALKEIEDEWAVAYIKAYEAGIETFNQYLPVMTHVSTYLELPGVNYDSESHQATGGTISEFSGQSEIGNFDTPKLKVTGYESGRWFKSKDMYSQNADGTWTRTEQWTYTSDTKHTWIYTGVLDGDGK